MLPTILALVGTSTAVPARQHRSGFDGGILFPNPNGGQGAYAVTWRKVPSDDQIRKALSSSVTVEGRTQWVCHVDRQGKLQRCTMPTSWPRDVRYEQAGRRLLKHFIVSPQSAADARRDDAEVVFGINFFGAGLERADMSSCPPPFCIPVPPPPR